MLPTGLRSSGFATRLPTVTGPTRSTCCSTTPVSAAAAVWLPTAATNGSARSTFAGGGVYNCTRAFLPMLQNAEEGHIVNTSSINGFWASVGPRIPHTAYSAAKFAVKGFTEALIADLRVNAPHIQCSVVMPGQIGT